MLKSRWVFLVLLVIFNIALWLLSLYASPTIATSLALDAVNGGAITHALARATPVVDYFIRIFSALGNLALFWLFIHPLDKTSV